MRNSERTPIYNAWVNMKGRCDNSSRPDYARYGGRGISYSCEWLSFTIFCADMGPSWREGLSLDRKDNNGNYTKENCRWATKQEQNTNTSKTKITMQQASEIKELRQKGWRTRRIAEHFNVSDSIVSNVIHGWSHKES